jgi:hypothetical protein
VWLLMAAKVDQAAFNTEGSRVLQDFLSEKSAG